MKRRVILSLLVVTFVMVATLAAARNARDVSPRLHLGNPSKAFGDLLFDLDVSSTTGSDSLLGVEWVSPYFYVSGRDDTIGHQVYVLDINGNLVDQFPQGTTTQWGFRDLAWDGQYLYGSDSTLITAFQTDGAMVPAANITGPEDPCRALAYDPATDHFWVANYTSPIYEITRSGDIVNQYPNDWSVYGLAWDDVSSGGPFLWAFEQDTNSIRQFDPATGTYTGEGISTGVDPYYGNAGGLTFTADWGSADDTAILIGLLQTSPDQVFGYEVIHEVWPTLHANFTNNPPTIDGDIQTDEWSDAWSLNYSGVNYDLNIKLMGDTQYLYGAVEVVGDTQLTSGDELELYFDNNNDNDFPADCTGVTDGYYQLSYNGSAVDLFYTTLAGDPPTPCDVVTPTAVTAAAGFHTNVMWEFKIDYTAGEMWGQMGAKIGFLIHAINSVDRAAGNEEIWPVGGDPLSQATYGDLSYQKCAGCLIDAYCHASGEPNPDNSCEVCNPAASPNAWSNRDGFVCGDDGVFCNGDEVCVDHACTGHTGDPCPDDGLWCTGAESCDEQNAQCVHEFDPVTNPRCPDDGLWCTGQEICSPVFHECLHVNVPCPADSGCDEATHECTAVDDDTLDDDAADDDTADDDTVDDDGSGDNGGDNGGCGC